MKILRFSFLAVVLSSCVARTHNNNSIVKGGPGISFSGRGSSQIVYPVPQTGVKEFCILPVHQEGFDYSKGDTQDENELCGYNWHKNAGDAQAGTSVGACPKINSTNTGVDLFQLPSGMTRAQFNQTICKLGDDARSAKAKKLAKLKSSITCSYAPSILSYYHLSRALGGAGDVPSAVLRSMDLTFHKGITNQALNLSVIDSFMLSLWREWIGVERDRANDRDSEKLFTSDFNAIYGALSDNPRGEDRYPGLNVRSSGSNIATAFMNTKGWGNVVNAAPIGGIVGRTLPVSAQTIIQMRDIADMVLMDHVLSQQDRFGNIHMEEYFYFLENGEVKDVKVSKVEKGEKPKPANAVRVMRMMMKDNDCGVIKSNVAVANSMLSKVRHMSPKTYKRFRWFAAEFINNSSFRSTFAREAAFQPSDTQKVLGLVKSAKQILETNCRAGNLLLDLNLDDHLASKNKAEDVKKICEETFEPKPTDGDNNTPPPVVIVPPTNNQTDNSGGCTEAPFARLNTKKATFTLKHGSASTPEKFRATLTVIDGQPAKKPEFTHKFFVNHSENDQSNIGFFVRDNGRQIEGDRYNMKFEPNQFHSFTLSWNCNRYEGQFLSTGELMTVLPN